MMRRSLQYAFIVLLLAPSLASAHGPSRQRVDMQIEINASPEQVWAVVQDFCSIKDWHPAVTDCTADGGNEPDSIRTLTMENGEQFTEQLARHQPENFTISYMLKEMNTDALPVSTFGSRLMIESSGNGSVVSLRGAFYRGHTQNDPPPELSDQAAIEAVTAFYDAALNGIKAKAEQ